MFVYGEGGGWDSGWPSLSGLLQKQRSNYYVRVWKVASIDCYIHVGR